MNSGVFVCDLGTSSIYEGLLSKQDVLDASQQSPYSRHDVERLIGGSIHDKIKSTIGHIMHKKGHHHAHKVGGAMGAAPMVRTRYDHVLYTSFALQSKRARATNKWPPASPSSWRCA